MIFHLKSLRTNNESAHLHNLTVEIPHKRDLTETQVIERDFRSKTNMEDGGNPLLAVLSCITSAAKEKKNMI